MTKFLNISTDNTLGGSSPSDETVSSQKAIKNYVDASLNTKYDASNPDGYITSSALSGYQTTANLVTSVSSSSTDSQYPSAKLFYDTCGDIETLINAL